MSNVPGSRANVLAKLMLSASQGDNKKSSIDQKGCCGEVKCTARCTLGETPVNAGDW